MERTRVYRRGILKVGVFFCIMGIGSYFLYQAGDLYADSIGSVAIAGEIQKIEEMGEPATIEQLVPRDIPDGENGALVYNQAIYLLKELKGRYKKEWEYIPYEGSVKWEKVPGVEKDKVRNLLFSNPDFVRLYQLLVKASGMEAQFLKKNDYKGAATALPHFSSLRNCSQMLAARAYLQAEQGNIDGAMQDCLICLKMARSFPEDPFLISGLVRIAMDKIALERMEEIMKHGNAKPDTYRTMIEIVRKERNASISYRGFLGERVLVMTELATIKKHLEEKKDIELLVRQYTSEKNEIDRITKILQHDPSGFMVKNELVYLRIMASWISLTRKPYFESREQFPVLEKELSGIPDEDALFAKIMIPNLSRVITQEARSDAQLGNAEIALACHLYKGKYKVYPSYLEELSPEFLPELPLDPFTGKNYIYRKNDNGFIVYSVGDNLKDDTGRFGQGETRWNYDIVWRE